MVSHYYRHLISPPSPVSTITEADCIWATKEKKAKFHGRKQQKKILKKFMKIFLSLSLQTIKVSFTKVGLLIGVEDTVYVTLLFPLFSYSQL